MATKRRPKPDQKTRTEATVDPFPLTEELKTFETNLSGWDGREGQWVLIKGRDVVGFYPNYDQALECGYQRFDAGPFLVKQIFRSEPIYQVGNIEL